MAKSIQPNMKCRLIGGTEGPNNSPNKGRICVTIHQQPLDHEIHGPLWFVKSIDGTPFVSQYGAVGNHITVAEDWLEPLPDDEPEQDTRTTEKTLETQ